MSCGHPLKILVFLVVLWATNIDFVVQCDEIIETKVFEDSSGHQHEEYAFRPPVRGVPNQILRTYCANMKLRLYWGVFREQAKSAYRYGANLRRMARFAKHVYDDIRKVDKPFNATQLSIVDEFFGVKNDDSEDDDSEQEMLITKQANPNQLPCRHRLKKSRFHTLTKLFSWSAESSSKNLCTDQVQQQAQANAQEQEQEIKLEESNESLKELELKHSNASAKIKSYFKKYAPKVGIGIYTRWTTMWWLMMSCLFAKYYLWDPALDEFQKLQRNLVMYPDILLVKLQDINCRPVKFFQRILGVCGILNPIMNIDFGQFSLDKMTRFKSDIVKEI